jgi:hypothetical protein
MAVGRADFYFITGVGIATGHDPIKQRRTWKFHGAMTAGSTGAIRSRGSSAGSRNPGNWFRWCLARAGPLAGPALAVDISSGVYAGFLFGTMSEDARAA